jgi:hypothetical protein
MHHIKSNTVPPLVDVTIEITSLVDVGYAVMESIEPIRRTTLIAVFI